MKDKNNSYNRQGDYETFVVEQEQPLLEFLLEHVKTLNRSKIKQTLQGRGVIVNGKQVTQFDYLLEAWNEGGREPFEEKQRDASQPICAYRV